MKKIIYSVAILAIAFIFTSLKTNAQSYGVGTNVINAGLGFGYSVRYGNGTATPVISGSFEHGTTELGPGTLGLGGIVSYQGNAWSYNDGVGDQIKYKWSTLFIGARGTWHPDALVGDKYDVYGGLQLGYYHYGYNYTVTGPYAGSYHSYSNPLNSGIGIGAFVGGRYYFANSIGVFGELGYDISYLKIGLSIKFGGE